MSFEFEHDTDKWGSLLSPERRDLVRLANVVAFCMTRDRLPVRRAAAAVLDALAALPLADLFLLKPGDFAEQLTDATVIPYPGPNVWWVDALSTDAAFDDLSGSAQVIWWVRQEWTEEAAAVADLDKSPGGALAMLASDAVRLFGGGVADGTEAGLATSLAPRWPHAKGVKWTDAEKDAMRAMREQGQSDEEIAKTVGCSRQVVGQQIGSKVASKAAKQTQNKLSVVG